MGARRDVKSAVPRFFSGSASIHQQSANALLRGLQSCSSKLDGIVFRAARAVDLITNPGNDVSECREHVSVPFEFGGSFLMHL